MFCKKRKARKAAKNAAVVAAMAVAEKSKDLDAPQKAELFAEKLTGDRKAMKKARKVAAKTARKAQTELKGIERRGGKRRPRKGIALLGLALALGIAVVAAYNAARPVEDPWKSA
ncbi:MAG: hypothetical protein Q3991_08095 [Rothia sp. (in: high G+C Gram-positive bacteria)]|uniref:hypothetical protein n=1 Tax=Rothia sp. (in: high G+C Gram-positive bacteria) TaxID=1885016 RepID=UPI0026DD9EC4|nr:hypothetical protein [Rothia sp. (in: high G+C Gram-positive bacteria)]MDO4884891.1 hypothetical protein [Rothia sp. (in: high G+C Gram-positive bacteria)]